MSQRLRTKLTHLQIGSWRSKPNFNMNIIDGHNRESLRIEIDTSLPLLRVI